MDYFRKGKELMFLCGLPTTGKSTLTRKLLRQAPHDLAPVTGCEHIEFVHLSMEDIIIKMAKVTGKDPSYWTSNSERWGIIDDILKQQVFDFFEERHQKLKNGVDLRGIVELPGTPTALTELGDIQFDPLPLGTPSQIIEQIGLEVYQGTQWWTPPSASYPNRGIVPHPDHVIHCFKSICDFALDWRSEAINWILLAGAPNLVNAQIGLIVREAVFAGNLDINLLATRVPLQIDQTKQDELVDSVYHSAPPQVILNTLHRGGRLAQAANSLYSGAIPPTHLPKWTEQKYIPTGEPLLFKPHYLSYMSNMVDYLNVVYRYLLSLPPDNFSVFLNRPVNPQTQVLVV